MVALESSLWILTRDRALSSSWHWQLNISFRCFSLETHKSQFAPENKQSHTSLLNLLLPGSIFTGGESFETHSDAKPQQHRKISLKTISDNNNDEPCTWESLDLTFILAAFKCVYCLLRIILQRISLLNCLWSETSCDTSFSICLSHSLRARYRSGNIHSDQPLLFISSSF